jgi:hypothetical protein
LEILGRGRIQSEELIATKLMLSTDPGFLAGIFPIEEQFSPKGFNHTGKDIDTWGGGGVGGKDRNPGHSGKKITDRS